MSKSGSRLPMPTTGLVGRQAERILLAEALSDERLVTLVGPPGVGKTRLALEVASEASGRFADSFVWVDLAPLDDADQVVSALARALKAPERENGDVHAAVVAGVGERVVLIVLDNCEHVVEGASMAAQAVVERCPRATVLATSRQALGVLGERSWQVSPLGVPEAGAGADAVAASDAGTLFCARACAADPAFAIGPDNASAVAEICRSLDGIPLAIELAAARTGVLPEPGRVRTLHTRALRHVVARGPRCRPPGTTRPWQ